ncbi:MAG: hypothetical protein SGJ05_03765 [bacterium]|nr:hypothetical protein [bacterium]
MRRHATSAGAIVLLCALIAICRPPIHAQGITRAWTAPFQKGASSVTYSHGALLYAYLLNDSTIVRALDNARKFN